MSYWRDDSEHQSWWRRDMERDEARQWYSGEEEPEEDEEEEEEEEEVVKTTNLLTKAYLEEVLVPRFGVDHAFVKKVRERLNKEET